MTNNKVLIIDDETDLCDILLFNLSAAGFQAQAVSSAEEALRLDIQQFDLLLLDVMMEGISGFELAERLKANDRTAHIPIIFITAKDTEYDTLHGFRLGADDYVRKPFSVKEVVARVKAVLGRKGDYVIYDKLKIDCEKKTVYVDGADADLTKTEFDLLHCLLTHRGHVFSRQELIERVWRPDVIVSDRAVDVNITRMRKKIGIYGNLIVARQGFGYLFNI